MSLLQAQALPSAQPQAAGDRRYIVSESRVVTSLSPDNIHSNQDGTVRLGHSDSADSRKTPTFCCMNGRMTGGTAREA